MMNFVQKNYSRALWLFRIALALFCALGSFWAVETQAFMLSEWYGFFDAVPKSAFIYIFFGIFYAIAVELLARLFIYIILRTARIYTVPKNELTVWVIGALAVKYAVLAALNALYFLTPVVTVFGGVLFGFIANLIAFVLLWFALKKLYFNDKNAPFAFKAYAVSFAVVIMISIFFAGGGAI